VLTVTAVIMTTINQTIRVFSDTWTLSLPLRLRAEAAVDIGCRVTELRSSRIGAAPRTAAGTGLSSSALSAGYITRIGRGPTLVVKISETV